MKYFVLLFTIAILSCTKESANMENAYTFSKVKVSTAIKDDQIFHWLDSQNDFNMSGEVVRKKSSAALYYSKLKDELEIPPHFSINNCRSEIVNDTLVIRIGSTTYLSDYGMEIKYKNGKFFTIPFRTNDMIDFNELKKKKSKEVFFSRNRKLILDKYNYKTGDSVFGRIHAEIEESKKKNFKNKYFTTEHFVDGFFRAKVGEI